MDVSKHSKGKINTVNRHFFDNEASRVTGLI